MKTNLDPAMQDLATRTAAAFRAELAQTNAKNAAAEAVRDMPPASRLDPNVEPAAAAQAIVNLCEAMRAAAEAGAATSCSAVSLHGDRAVHIVATWARCMGLLMADEVRAKGEDHEYRVVRVNLAGGSIHAYGDDHLKATGGAS